MIFMIQRSVKSPYLYNYDTIIVRKWAYMHIKFAIIKFWISKLNNFMNVQLYISTWESSTIFTIYAVFHRESNALYRVCKSYTIMKIHTIT